MISIFYLFFLVSKVLCSYTSSFSLTMTDAISIMGISTKREFLFHAHTNGTLIVRRLSLLQDSYKYFQSI